jgi:phosphatidylglycerol:prolipoprotein diacylglycerol transferase
MFINNINPILVSIGPLSVRYYGLVYAFGFLLGYFFLKYSITHKRLKMTEDQLDIFMIWLIIGSIFMARIFEVFIYNLPSYINNPIEMLRIWNGGLSTQGGLVGAIIVTYIFCKKYKVHFYDIADLAIIPTTFVLFLGKLANYTNSELYGTITNPLSVPWCVIFQKVDTYCRHPVQIYEAIAVLILFGILVLVYIKSLKSTHKKQHMNGNIFWLFMLLYSVLRFVITFLRDEPLYAGLNVGQWLSLVIILISAIFLWNIWKTESKSI